MSVNRETSPEGSLVVLPQGSLHGPSWGNIILIGLWCFFLEPFVSIRPRRSQPPYPVTSSRPMNTVQKYFRVNPRDMVYVKSIVESYGGLAVLSTLDPQNGIMVWMIPRHRLKETEELIASLKKEVTLEPVDPTQYNRSRSR